METLGPNKGAISRRWTKSHNEELRNLCPSSNIVTMNTSRMIYSYEYNVRATCFGRNKKYVETLSVKTSRKESTAF
jgi:hypothetical protein